MKQTFSQLDVLKKKKGRRLIEAPCIRVSTGEQKKQQTAQIQHQKIIQFGKEQEINLLDPYNDEGYSGELSERPDLHRLLDDIEEKEIDLVILTEPDRLAREFGVQKFIQRQIEEKGSLLDGSEERSSKGRWMEKRRKQKTDTLWEERHPMDTSTCHERGKGEATTKSTRTKPSG